MATKSNIIKKKQPSYINGLKALTNWTFGKHRKQEDLRNIIETYGIDNNIFKRFILYTYNYPHITWYINKYMNHLYDFNKFETIDIINSITYLLDINRINKKSIPDKLLYLKNTELADKNKQKVKTLLHEYFNNLFDKEYNENELNFFYDLVNLNLITFEDIAEIDKHINSGKSTFVLEDTIMPNSPKINNFVLDIYREFPPGIKTFCDQAKEYIISRPECKECELYGKPSVILDTNMEDGGEVDIIFFGLNPGKEEVEIGKTFVGKAGKILRERMSLLPTHIKWVITNIILCHTRNESEIKNPEAVKNRCSGLVDGIKQTFPAKVIVPLGAKAANAFGLKGGMANISGKVFTNNNQTLIPIIHPSAANYNAENLTKFKNDFATILNLYKSQEPANIQIPIPETPKQKITNIDISSDKFINNITPDLTFFDIREIDNRILLIFIDQNGRKRYKLEEYKLHFYLKNSNWTDCEQITNQVDAVVNIAGREKSQAIKHIRDKLNSIKKI